MTINGCELITLLDDEDEGEYRRIREIIDDLACPNEDEREEITDYSGIWMV